MNFRTTKTHTIKLFCVSDKLKLGRLSLISISYFLKIITFWNAHKLIFLKKRG